MTPRPPRGFALVLAVAFVLALSILGLGALALGAREAAIAGALQLRHTAHWRTRHAALAALDQWSTRDHADLAIGQARTLPGADSAVVEVVRIDTALYLVRAEGTAMAGPVPATASAGLLVRTLDPGRAAAHFPGALTADASVTLDGGRVDASDACERAPAVVAPLLDGEPGAVLISGSHTYQAIPGPLPAPYPFTPAAADLLDALSGGPGTLSPTPLVHGGRCVPGPDNWGSPDARHPCHGLLPVVLVRGPVTLDGGVARAILIVDGDLTLTGRAVTAGIIVATGRVVIQEGVRVLGPVRARDIVLGGGEVTRSACDLPVVLAAPALDRPFRPPGRWWVPVF